MSDDQLARAAYAAYGQATGGLNYQGLPMPKWEGLGETIQQAWRAAAEAAAHTGESVEEHGYMVLGGGVTVWPADSAYSLESRVDAARRHGSRVVRRRVIMVDEWEEI